MQETGRDVVRLAVALRAGRSALGLSQVEFAEQIGVSKSTLARVETGEGSLSAEALMSALRFFRENGVYIEFLAEEGVKLDITEAAIDRVLTRLADSSIARSDRKKSVPRRMLREYTIPNPALAGAKASDDKK